MQMLIAVLLMLSSGLQESLRDSGGKMKSTFVMRTRLTAFAVTLQVWTIQPTGNWTWEQFSLRDGTDEPELNEKREGKLTDAQLTGLAKTLNEMRLDTLPHSIGKDPEINFLNIELVFDKHGVTVRGLDPPMDGGLVKSLQDQAHAVEHNEKTRRQTLLRIAELVELVQKITTR